MITKGTHYNPEIEAAILGACMLEKSAFSRVFGVLKRDMFYLEGNQLVFDAMVEMFDRNYPIEMLTVWDFLQREKGLNEIVGYNTAYYVSRLTSNIVSTANMEYHAMVLQKMWCERELINITSSGTSLDSSIQARVKKIQDKLMALQTSSVSDGWKTMDELIVDLYKHQDKIAQTKGMGLATGFKTIDRIYGGFHPGQMIVIGARPSIGKSAIAGQMAMNIAASGKKVGIISLEMSNNEIAARIAAIDTGINYNTIYRNLFTDEYQRDQFYKRLNSSASQLQISVSEKTDVNISAIKAQAMKLKYKSGLDCLIVDYLQLIGGETTKNKNRENIVSEISRGFKILVKELDIPGIMLCQLNREVEKRKNKERYPQLSDFRESGAIEQDADVAMFLHSDYMIGILTDDEGRSTENVRELVIRKWRNGVPNIIIKLEFDGPRMKFKEYGQFTVAPVSPHLPYSDKDEGDDLPF